MSRSLTLINKDTMRLQYLSQKVIANDMTGWEAYAKKHGINHNELCAATLDNVNAVWDDFYENGKHIEFLMVDNNLTYYKSAFKKNGWCIVQDRRANGERIAEAKDNVFEKFIKEVFAETKVNTTGCYYSLETTASFEGDLSKFNSLTNNDWCESISQMFIDNKDEFNKESYITGAGVIFNPNTIN